MRMFGKPKAGSVARSVVVFAVVLAVVSGLVLATGTQASGVSCSAGESSVTVSWNGEFRAFQYTAWVRDSSGTESGEIVDWSSGGTESASAEFTGLSADTYTVWVVMQTVDGSWINIGETTCTVSAPATPTPTATPTPVATSGPGTIGCSTGASSITVTLDPQTGTTSWEVFVEHSTGNPRIGQSTSRTWSQAQLDILNNDDPDDDAAVLNEGPQGDLSLSTTFSGLAQGSWTVSGSASISGQTERSTIASITCTVAGGL